MSVNSETLAELIASRICHDLISPIGAIGNGIELMSLDEQAKSPEFDLLSSSADHAACKIRQFRIAFGHARPGQVVPRREVESLLAGMSSERRLRIAMQVPGDLLRPDAKLLTLMLMCLEGALPKGGDVTIGRDDAGWDVKVRGDSVSLRPEHWGVFSGEPDAELSPSSVHFHLAAELARLAGRSVTVEATPSGVSLRF